MKLLNIGFGNMVSAERLIAVVSPDSVKRLGVFLYRTDSTDTVRTFSPS